MFGNLKFLGKLKLVIVGVCFVGLTVSFGKQKEEVPADQGTTGEGPSLAKEKPWVDLENKLGLLRRKREAQAAALKKLKDEKDLLKNGTDAFKEKHKEFQKTYADWMKTGDDYNKMMNLLKYRYPERVLRKNAGTEESMKAKSIEELELEMGIDGKLNKAIRKVKGQFGDQTLAPVDNNASKSKAGSDPDQGDSIEAEPQIILKK